MQILCNNRNKRQCSENSYFSFFRSFRRLVPIVCAGPEDSAEVAVDCGQPQHGRHVTHQEEQDLRDGRNTNLQIALLCVFVVEIYIEQKSV